MMAPRDVTVPAVVDHSDLRFWLKDRARVEQEILDGNPFRVLGTDGVRHDAMIEFLLRGGLLGVALGVRASGLTKNLGFTYRCLLGLQCLFELVGIFSLPNC